MSVKKLELVQAPGTDHPLPPRPLGKDGMAMWAHIQGEYSVTDSGGMQMLHLACAAIDRSASLLQGSPMMVWCFAASRALGPIRSCGTKWRPLPLFAAHCIGSGSTWRR